MKNALSINKYINKFLTESEAVTSLVSVQNIRPLILAPTIFPYVSFMHGNISSSYTKDGWSEDTTEVTIIAVSDDYSQTVDIAEAVRELLDNKAYKDEDIYISEMRLSGATEDQIENVFVQRLSFTVKISAF
jgi:DNA-binding protein